MSVLCCRIPNFLITLACQRQPEWDNRPLALLGPDERVWAASPQAAQAGVAPALRAQQAQLLCPEVLLRPLDVAHSQESQQRFLETLADWTLPVEPQEWGLAYIDLRTIARTAESTRPLAVELGRRLRGQMGDALQPAIGWDSGKFTARAAALRTASGRLRLVDAADEVRFLAPLPVTLLPLPARHLQQLHWLGVRTLGQFAALPPAAVWQRFGAAGKLAQQWACGHDSRPVQPLHTQGATPATVTLDPPTGLLQPAVDAVMAALRPLLEARSAGLEGIRRLRLRLTFVDATERTEEFAFVEPVSQPARLQATLVQRFCTLRWPAALQAVQWTLLESGELTSRQLALFDNTPARLTPLAHIASKLTGRYGPVLFRGSLDAAYHPVAERRGAWASLG